VVDTAGYQVPAISYRLVGRDQSSRGDMTAADFLTHLKTLGWTKLGLVQRLRCDTNLPTRWGRGDAAVPPRVAVWLRALARAMEAHPAPQDWRRRE
jgi:hypothetical protein